MPTQVLLAPVGSGKTETALRLLATAQSYPFDPVWVLLPTKRQEDAFRQRLIEGNQRLYFNVSFFNFYTLYQHLLNSAGKPQRELDDTARYRLLRNILERLKQAGQLTAYNRIAQTPGFIKIVANFIYELKQNLVQPEMFEQVAQRRGTGKDRDLARIYIEYQETLRHYDLVDREGEGWLALEVVHKQPNIAAEVALLLADGFDHFNLLQARLLALLSGRVHSTVVTLPTVPGRNDTVGRRFQRALASLRTAHEAVGQTLDIQTDPALTEIGYNRHPSLAFLLENSFFSNSPATHSDGCLTLIEAPDPAQEVSAILRRIKRLLVENNCRPDDILIAVRDWERYGYHLATQARVYGIPLALHYGEPLGNNPAILALLSLLELSEHNFRRHELLDVLRSPYFEINGLSSEHIDEIERLSRAQQVIGGELAWLDAITLSASTPLDKDDEHGTTVITGEEAQYLLAHITAFFQAVKPPPEGTLAEYVAWLEALIGPDISAEADTGGLSSQPGYSLHLLFRVRQGHTEVVSRDLAALQQFKQILRSLITAQALLTALGQPSTLSRSDFLSELKRTIQSAAVDRHPVRYGRVLVTSVTDARGLPHRHVFIPGLSEGIFPAPTVEDPLYLDSERQALADAGIPLETRAERSGDEAVYYELLGLARETLTLSRPAIQDGALWPESHLWRAVKTVFTDANRIIETHALHQGRVTSAAEVASLPEAALIVADSLNHPQVNPITTNLYNWLVSEQSDYWAHIRLGRQIELSRLSPHPFDRYSGRLQDKRLRKWVADELGPQHIWSASQLNDYGMCGFRFFAKRLLRLEELEEPEEGMDAAQLGTLNHEILEKTYQKLSDAGLEVTPENTPIALQFLTEVAAHVLHDAPAKLGFRPSALWEQEQTTILRKLEMLVRLDFSEDGPVSRKFGVLPRQLYRLEAPFGISGDVIDLALDDTIGPLRARGYIDRIDRQGDSLIIIDYKTGSKPIPTKEMERGRNFQMMLYLLVARHMLQQDASPYAPKHITGGMFWHLGTRQPSGDIQLDEAGWSSIQRAWEHLSSHIQSGRNGNFPIHSGKTGPCAHYCEFSQMCRVSTINQHKRE